MSEIPREEIHSGGHSPEENWRFDQFNSGLEPKLPELEVIDPNRTEEVHLHLGSTALLEDQDIEPRFAA